MSALLPLYHPTTCLVIDDDQLFLDSFDYNYADVTLCATEQRPERAIQRLLKDAGRTDLTIEEANCAPVDEGEASDPVIRLPASRIAAMARDPARFSRVSVVVVDFAMPSMTGVELLKQIKHLPVKKVLLTGKAGDFDRCRRLQRGPDRPVPGQARPRPARQVEADYPRPAERLFQGHHRAARTHRKV